MFTYKKVGRKTAILSASTLLLALSSQASAAVVGFALDGTGANLVSFDVANPAMTTSVQIGDGTQQISAIDFRPATGDLIAYSNTSNA